MPTIEMRNGVPASVPLPYDRFIDKGPFTDRLGAKKFAIDSDTRPGVIAVRSDLNRREWIDLDDPRVAGGLYYLAGQPVPEIGPTLTEPILTMGEVVAAISAPVQPKENSALIKKFFS
jgi:hypothetical protein